MNPKNLEWLDQQLDIAYGEMTDAQIDSPEWLHYNARKTALEQSLEQIESHPGLSIENWINDEIHKAKRLVNREDLIEDIKISWLSRLAALEAVAFRIDLDDYDDIDP